MKALRLMLVLVAAFVASSVAPLYAQEEKPGKESEKKEGEAKEDEAEEEDILATLKKQFKDVDKVISGVTLTKEDVEAYEKYEEAFDEFVDSDPKFEELSNKSIKEAFEYAIKNEKYLAWAKERGLEAETWLRKAVRILTFGIRKDLVNADETIDSLKEWKKSVAEMKGEMSEDEYKQAIDEIDASIKMYEGMRDFAKTLPVPTDAEAKLLAEEEGSDAGSEDAEDEGSKD